TGEKRPPNQTKIRPPQQSEARPKFLPGGGSCSGPDGSDNQPRPGSFGLPPGHRDPDRCRLTSPRVPGDRQSVDCAPLPRGCNPHRPPPDGRSTRPPLPLSRPSHDGTTAFPLTVPH